MIKLPLFSKKTAAKDLAKDSSKVVIIGIGGVGSATAFSMLIQGVASELVLIDENKERCIGEVFDLEHGALFAPKCKIINGTYDDCAGADVVVVTAGVAQKPGQTRLDLAKDNTKIIKDVVENITKYTKDAIILMVTNPLDVMTYVAAKTAGLREGQVLGTGTTLDSSRFRHYLAEMLKIDPKSLGAYIIGEHGESQVPAVSHANVMGEPIKNLPGYNQEKIEQVFTDTRTAAANVIKRKGFTAYAIALAVTRIVKAVLSDEKHVFPVSTPLSGQYGLSDVALSVPCVVGRKGVEKILEIDLSAQEKEKLQESAAIIKESIKSVL